MPNRSGRFLQLAGLQGRSLIGCGGTRICGAMPLKVALVGCGKIADDHVSEVQKLDGLADVVAVCDREKLMAEQLAERFDVPATYDDFEKMLQLEKPDVVHIATPPASHLALTRMAVDAGCHVYVEKPITLRHEDTVKLIDTVQTAGKKMTVGYAFVYDPPAQTLREQIAAGDLGDIVHIETFYGYNLGGPYGQALLGDSQHWVHSLPGKLLQNTIDHLLSRVIEMMPGEIVVNAFGGVRRPERYGDERDGFHDELRLLLRTADAHASSSVSAYLTFSSHVRPMPQIMRVYGTKNVAHIDYNARTLTLDQQASLPSAIGRLVPAFHAAGQHLAAGSKNIRRFIESDFHYFAGMSELLRRFYRCITEGTEPPIALDDLLRISSVIDQTFQQLDQSAPETSGGQS